MKNSTIYRDILTGRSSHNMKNITSPEKLKTSDSLPRILKQKETVDYESLMVLYNIM